MAKKKTQARKPKADVGDEAVLEVRIGRDTMLHFNVLVLAVSESYGRYRYLVKPKEGRGQAQVEKITKKK